MEEMLKAAIEKCDCDFVDCRYDKTDTTVISCNGEDIEGVNSSKFEGGSVRVLLNGGIARSAFDRPDCELLSKALEAAVKSARASQKAGSINQGLTSAPVVRCSVKPKPLIDPRTVSFDEKVALLKHYSTLALKVEKVEQAQLTYRETVRNEWYVNGEGSVILQEVIHCYIAGRITAKDGNDVEVLSATLGYSPDYSKLLNRDEIFIKKARLAAELTTANHAPSGTFKVITAPSLGGVFIHEAFGHLSETDTHVYNPPIREMMKIGKRFGGKHLQVFDWGDLQDGPGSNYYDHEGIRCQNTEIIKDGILVGKLYSRNSAYHLGAKPTGNYRACDYRFSPLIRQSNICLGGGDTSFEEMLTQIDDGLYLCEARGGQTMGDFFTFGCQYGYRIRKGKLCELVRGTNISGNVERTMNDIEAVGNDFTILEGGGCGRSRAGFFNIQLLDKSGRGSPHILINNLVIGGAK